MIRILEIKQQSRADGAEHRSVVVLKGCSLACAWCPEPESIDSGLRVRWNEAPCVGCGSCVEACRANALSLTEEGVWIEQSLCTGCGTCSEVCPASAMEKRGRDYDVEELAGLLLENRADFGMDGGITLSGGEALLQSDTVRLLRILKKEGVSITLRTNGLAPNYRLLQALGFTDTVLFGIRIMDTVRHRQFTGQGNELILSNLRLVSDWGKNGGHLWVETPVIPDATDSGDNIASIGECLAKLGGTERWTLSAFDPDCRSAYERLYIDWPYKRVPLMTRARAESLLSVARMTGACQDIRVTGPFRPESKCTNA